MKKKGSMIWLFIAIIWAAVIFLFSSRTGVESHETSTSLAAFLSRLLVPDFASWGPSSQTQWISDIDNLLRKMAHFFEFGVLGVLTYLTVLNLSRGVRRRKPASKFGLGMISFYICAVISALDEVFQIFSSGRTSSPKDILIDCAGIALGIIICAYKTKLPGNESRQGPAVRRRG